MRETAFKPLYDRLVATTKRGKNEPEFIIGADYEPVPAKAAERNLEPLKRRPLKNLFSPLVTDRLRKNVTVVTIPVHSSEV